MEERKIGEPRREKLLVQFFQAGNKTLKLGKSSGSLWAAGKKLALGRIDFQPQLLQSRHQEPTNFALELHPAYLTPNGIIIEVPNVERGLQVLDYLVDAKAENKRIPLLNTNLAKDRGLFKEKVGGRRVELVKERIKGRYLSRDFSQQHVSF